MASRKNEAEFERCCREELEAGETVYVAATAGPIAKRTTWTRWAVVDEEGTLSLVTYEHRACAKVAKKNWPTGRVVRVVISLA